MTKVIDLINAIDPSGKYYDVFLQDLLSVNDDLPSDTEEVNNLQNAIISHVNARLNQSSTRNDGMIILGHILPRCGRDVLTKYAVLWIAKATQSLTNPQSNTDDIALACKILAALIVACKDIPELQKQISMQSVKQLVNVISNLEAEKKCGGAFYLVATILYHYKEPSERLQNTLKKMIVSLIDEDKKNLIQAGANCYTLLARVTERSFKPPASKPNCNGWVYAQALICNALHSIMDDLFSGLIELESIEVWDKLELPNIPEENVIDYYRGLEKRFVNLCVYLSTMLRGCSGKNSVSPNEVLQVLCRGLAVTPASLRSEYSFRKQMICFILPKVHVALFNVLNSFIEGFTKELVPFAITILQLYHQTLKWIETVGENKTTINGGKPFKNVKIAVYKSLTTWLSCLGTLSGIEMVDEDFFPHILKDVTPEKERVLLTVQKTQHLSKRALKRFKDNQYENSVNLGNASVATKNPCTNADLCTNALISLQSIFFNASCSLKPSFYKAVQNLIVPLLYDYYLGKRDGNFYDSNNECRLNLLRVLKAIQLNPHYSSPPPTQYSIEIFGMAQRDVDRIIVEEAKMSMAELEKIAHPSAPSLELARQNSDETSNATLEIHWNRPAIVEESVINDNVVKDTSNVWNKFMESRDETVAKDENQRIDEITDETRDVCAAKRSETAENLDGPTPSKQAKLVSNEPGELMDTSEDEIIVNASQNNEISTTEKIMPPSYVSPKKFEKSTVLDSSQSQEELPKSEENEPSYLTLKEIYGESDSRDDVRISQENSQNDNERENDSQKNKSNEETEIQADKCFDDNSDDETAYALFCDQVKDF